MTEKTPQNGKVASDTVPLPQSLYILEYPKQPKTADSGEKSSEGALTALNFPPAREQVGEFLSFLQTKGRSPITTREYRPRIMELFALTGRGNVAELTKDDMIKFGKLISARSDSMYNMTAMPIRKFLSWAFESSLNQSDLSHFMPTQKIPKKPKEEYVWLAFQEQQKLIAACTNIKEQLVIMFPLKTGVRNGRYSPRREFCGIHWEDIDLDRRHVKIYGKGAGEKGKIRYPHFDDATKTLLEKYRDAGGRMPVYKKASRNTKIVRGVALRAGLIRLARTNRPFHALKHSFCSTWCLIRRLKNLPEDLRGLSEQVGTGIDTLEIYIHIADEYLKSSYDETMKALKEYEREIGTG